MDNDELLAKQAETNQYWDTYTEGNLSADEAREMALKIADSTGKPALVDGYYEVQNPIQWVWFVNHVEQENKVNCALVDDLDLSEYPNLPRLSNFRGTMDGRDHKITIKLTATDKEFAFINSAYNATFCNLRLDQLLTIETIIILRSIPWNRSTVLMRIGSFSLSKPRAISRNSLSCLP